jgi:hypothetical protein
VSTGARPKYSATEALERCRKLLDCGTYKLGALDEEADKLIFDCFSFVVRYGYGLDGHRPGFNRDWKVDWMTGWTASVVDDLNSNSAVENALFGDRELFEVVLGPPRLGDIIAAPTIRLPGHPDPWVGHAVMVTGITRAKGVWDPARPTFAMLDVIECRGPDGRNPAIRQTNGTWFDERAGIWPKVQHRPWLLRVNAPQTRPAATAVPTAGGATSHR